MAKKHSDPKTADSVRVTRRGVPNKPPRTGPRPQDRSKESFLSEPRHYGPPAPK